LARAQASQAKADAGWDKIVSDRRKADTDRRKPGAVWDRSFPDRRTAERRGPDAGLAALVKAVADRDKAYTDRSKAETELAAAMVSLNAASAERERALTALDELGDGE
jgi:hypothetical protein